jgi:hypothetical protein
MAEQEKVPDILARVGISKSEYRYGVKDKARAEKGVAALRAAGYDGARMYRGGSGGNANWWTVSPQSYKEGWKKFGEAGLPVLGAIASAIATIYGGPAAGAAVAAATGMGTKAIAKSKKGVWHDPGAVPPSVPMQAASLLPAGAVNVQGLVPQLSTFNAQPYDQGQLLRLLAALQGGVA